MTTPWYRRILAWFSGDEPNNIEKHEIVEYFPQIETTRKQKGNFRFPLIPDDEYVTSKPKLRNSADDRKRIEPTNQLLTEPLRLKNTKKEDIDLLEREREERRRERVQLFKERDRLFAERGWLRKAQEVPSPVFGFQRPKPVSIPVHEDSDPQTEHMVQIKEELIENADVIDVTEKYDHYTENKHDEKSSIDVSFEKQSDRQYDSHFEEQPEMIDEVEEQTEVQNETQHVHPVAEKIEDVSDNQNVGLSEYQKDNQVDAQQKSRKPTSKVPYNVFYFGNQQEQSNSYQFPKLQFLTPSPPVTEEDLEWQMEMIDRLEQTLLSFHVQAKVVGITKGPTVTRLELQPAPGVKVNRITGLSDDIKLNLAAKDIRIEAPVPGRSAVGIEIPNLVREPVNIADIIASPAFQNSKSPLSVALGKDIEGKPVVIDLRKMPHGLIAGSTGSGKSVCINSIIVSLLYKARPEEVKMILIDPKMVELAPYHDLPHLATPVVTDPKQATMALKWAVEEMDRRYELFAQSGVRDIDRYNQLMAETRPDVVKPALPYILIVIDELADLMMVAPGDVEELIARIAQKARACGIHLLVATQRPSVDVITGMIKANIPTRIAFSVSSQVDSRTILDSVGAERLLGRGDMLLMENGGNKAVRVQGNYVADDEIAAVCHYVRCQRKPKFLFDKESLLKAVTEEPEDELFREAVQFIIEQETASTSLLQRKFRIGYNRAARLIDMMEERGMISEASGSKPRNVLITQDDIETWNE